MAKQTKASGSPASAGSTAGGDAGQLEGQDLQSGTELSESGESRSETAQSDGTGGAEEGAQRRQGALGTDGSTAAQHDAAAIDGEGSLADPLAGLFNPFGAIAWPLTIKVTNNSHCALHSESTGLFVPCGEWRTATYEDEAHARPALEGLASEIQTRGYPVGSIVIEGPSADND